jgi:hypothetical protein
MGSLITSSQVNLTIPLKDMPSAAEAFANILTVDPNNREAFITAIWLNHEILFNFDKAIILAQQWLGLYPEDILVKSKFAEMHLTNGRFAECGKLVNALLQMPEVPVSTKTALRAIEIASGLADGKANQVPAKIDALIIEITHQSPEFNVAHNLNGTRHFIDQNEKLFPQRAWLGQLLDALTGTDRDTMLKALRKVQENFNR